MVRAAQTPANDTDEQAVLWMESYCYRYGDFSPNSDEVKFSVMMKKDVYSKYESDMRASNRKPVQYTRFINLWNSLFPKCRSRPWCAVMGKCHVCAEIDRLRRVATSDIELQKLQECHMMHRGGMFMLERMGYICLYLTSLRINVFIYFFYTYIYVYMYIYIRCIHVYIYDVYRYCMLYMYTVCI